MHAVITSTLETWRQTALYYSQLWTYVHPGKSGELLTSQSHFPLELEPSRMSLLFLNIRRLAFRNGTVAKQGYTKSIHKSFALYLHTFCSNPNRFLQCAWGVIIVCDLEKKLLELFLKAFWTAHHFKWRQSAAQPRIGNPKVDDQAFKRLLYTLYLYVWAKVINTGSDTLKYHVLCCQHSRRISRGNSP